MGFYSFPERTLDGVLPKNATDYLRNLSAVGADRMLPFTADELRNLWNPAKCEESVLPFLAWALSVDVWDADWPTDKKRRVLANAFLDHQRKGTLATIKQYLGYRGCTVDKVITPPARCFGVIGLTDTQREVWISRLPQIRVYPFETDETAPPARAFMSRRSAADSLSMYRTFYGSGWMQQSKGPLYYGIRATLALPGQDEVPVAIDYPEVYGQTAPAQTISISTVASPRLFMGGKHYYGQGFMQTSAGPNNQVQVKLSEQGALQFAALNGGQLQDVRPVRVYPIRTAPRARMFCNRDSFGNSTSFMLSSKAPRLIYDRFALVDSSVPVNLQPGRSFMGYARFGIAPYTAELRVEVPMARPQPAFGFGPGQYMRGFYHKTDFTPLDNCLNAISAGRALRDQVLVDTEIFRTVQVGSGLKLGSFKLAEVVRRT